MRCKFDGGRKNDATPMAKDTVNGDFFEIQIKEITNFITDEISVKYYLNETLLGNQMFEKSKINQFRATFTLGKKGQQILVNQADCQRLRLTKAKH